MTLEGALIQIEERDAVLRPEDHGIVPLWPQHGHNCRDDWRVLGDVDSLQVATGGRVGEDL